MATDSTQQTINHRYDLIDKLGAGGMGAVFRAKDRLTGQTVALKRVLSPIELPQGTPVSQSTDFRLALSREFRTLASLRHPNIVTVIDFGFDEEQRPYFTMNLVEGAKTLSEAAENQPKETRIRLVVELLQAMVYIHQRGILHRDLKPGNVLVDARGTVKMLDFGLSLASSQSMTNMEGGMVGTLAYMAPELFQEEEATVSSDLYAAGIVAYELFAGKRPFDSKNMALLLNQILNTEPDFSEIGENIAPVLDTLLSKDPEERYQTAIETLNEFCYAADYPHPIETEAIRESFLQTAPMVGRREELRHLRDSLNAAIAGNGNLQLVSGESGVGKSRLLDELRIRALVKGVIVLRGQAVSEGGSTYHVWREALRPLILHCNLNDEQAGILKALIPDIDTLLERKITEAAPLNEPALTQNRLFRTLKHILEELSQPILITLKDLQWAGADSIALINYLNSFLSNVPILIVGDYRDDEKPDIPDLLGNPSTIKLQRLNDEEILELSAAMLGEAGKLPHVVSLLQRETEGNAFFLVEVARTLAEEAGQLTEIGNITLPEKVFADGINSVIERRLLQVPDDARHLLELSAIVGRQLDNEVLQALEPDTDIDEWITICANNSVIEIQDEHWNFAHHKIRERILADFSEQERSKLYRRVAEAIETVYKDDAEHVATLAHLWAIADDNEKELHYAKLAGAQALGANLAGDALTYLQRALELFQQLPESTENSQLELEIRMPLSIALTHTQGFTSAEVEDSWTRSLDLCTILDNPPETVGVLWGLCGMYMVRGDNDVAANMDDQIFELAPFTPFPDLTRVQALYTRTINLIAIGEIEEALQSAKDCHALFNPEDSEQAIAIYGSNPGITVQAFEASLLQILGYSEQAAIKYEESLQAARKLNHPFTLSNILTFCWIIQLRGDVDRAAELASENLEIASEYGFGFNQLMGMPVLGWAMAQRGETEQGLGMIQQATAMLHSMGANLLRNYFLGILADAYIKLGQLAEAMEIVDEAIERIENSVDRFYEPEIYRLKAELLWEMHDATGEAKTFVQKAIQISRERNVRWFELRSTLCLGKMWQSQGNIQEAHQILEPIVNWFTEGLDTADLSEAREFLAELKAQI